jgi:putative MFS transporter
VLFILLNRWIPESPRFLLLNGREAEARAVMARYGAVLVEEAPTEILEPEETGRWTQLLSPQFLGLTLTIGFLALGSGLVLFGFNLWIPTNLRKLGFTQADTILHNAALLGLPLTFLVAWLYGFWSSKKTIILLGSLTATALFVLVSVGDAIVQNRVLLYALLVILLGGISSVIATLSVYCSEIYPTKIRARGTGFAASVSKAGGVIIISLVSFGFTVPSMNTIALIGAIPMTLAVILITIFGVETCKRRLDEIK